VAKNSSRPSRDKLALHPVEMNYIPAMQRLRNFFWMLMMLGLLALGVYVGLTVARWRGGGLRVENTATIIQQVQTLSDLVTVKYVMEKVVIVNSPPSSTLGQFVQGENRLLLLAHGIIKAGINLKRLQPGDVRVAGKSIYIHLPPPEITDAYLDEKQTQVIDWQKGFLRSFDKDLETAARQQAVDDLRRAARQAGILSDADERARLELAQFLHAAGFDHVEFQSGAFSAPAPAREGVLQF
jgi:hypothetical protein